MNSMRYDVAIVGAGPAGLACAIEAKKCGLSTIVLDKGCVVNSIVHFPVNMVFFTTPELLEIGELPMVSAQEKPTRVEGLKYYRRVVETYALNVHQYEPVMHVARENGGFSVRTIDRHHQPFHYTATNVVLATGYYDNPNLLKIPGEELPKVSHYYTEPHPYFDQEVAVIGGKNSAIEAALDLFRNGAKVTLIYRGTEFSGSIKYWIKPDIENRVKRGEIRAYFQTRVLEIKPQSIVLQNPEGTTELENDFVFAMTGYHPDVAFLRSTGMEIDPADMKPKIDPTSFESTIPGLYVAGSIVAGSKNNEIFIENGRFHGKAIIQAIQTRG